MNGAFVCASHPSFGIHSYMYINGPPLKGVVFIIVSISPLTCNATHSAHVLSRIAMSTLNLQQV